MFYTGYKSIFTAIYRQQKRVENLSQLSVFITILFGAPDRIDSRHPWRSPGGRLALLDVQIGCPADLSNLARTAQGPHPTPEH